MKNRKICAILIAAVFAVAAVVSCVFLSLVRRVDVKYVLSDGTDAAPLSASFDALKGKCVLFVGEDDVREILKDYPYFYLDGKVKRNFPNSVSFSVKERRETYSLNYDGKYYILDENGILLAVKDSAEQKRSVIDVEFSGVNLSSVTAGQPLSTDCGELFDAFLAMTKAVSLSDNVKKATLLVMPGRKDVLYETYTGVTVEIPDACDSGVEKAEAAFKAYNESADDYYKSFDKITVTKKSDGEMQVTWTDKSV